MSQPPLAALRAFEAVARLGSFSRAGDELCVTQSAVSHQVRALEDWFGAPLFKRRGNRATLLPHAAELAEALGSSFGDIAAACRRARRAGGPETLTVAAIPSVAICWLIPRLGAARAVLPGVETRLVYAIHGQAIDFHDIDLAIVFAETPPVFPAMTAAFFLSGATVPVAAPRPDSPLTPAEVLSAGLLHDTDETGWRRWLALAGAPDAGATPGPVFEDFNLLRAAALSGQGAALCPLAIVAEDLRAGRLVRLPGPMIRESAGYYVLTPAAPDPARAGAIARFRDWLLSTSAEARDP